MARHAAGVILFALAALPGSAKPWTHSSGVVSTGAGLLGSSQNELRYSEGTR